LVHNTPGLSSVGSEIVPGAQLELKFRLPPHLLLSTNYIYNDARYRNFTTVIDGGSVRLAGNQLPLSLRNLGGFGLTYSAPQGLRGSIVANFVGGRFLDALNSIGTGSYVALDASIGYGLRGYMISINGSNLSNRRNPVQESELGEGQFYLLPGRRAFVKVSMSL
jgi:hypothetical protein